MKRKRVRSERWRLGNVNAHLPHKTTKTIINNYKLTIGQVMFKALDYSEVAKTQQSSKTQDGT